MSAFFDSLVRTVHHVPATITVHGETMRAVGFRQTGPPEVLEDVELPKPTASGRDLLVKIQAVSVNPVDAKVRRGATTTTSSSEDNGIRVLGYDAAGIVEEVGHDCTCGFNVGDAVYYSGQLDRPGCNSEYHLVDERLVGHKPNSLTFAQAAALPLTTITAWEMLYDRLNIGKETPQGGRTILIVGGAGGVGSMAIQLVKALTDMVIIATASRDETRAWVQKLGAHYVINHRQPMAPQLQASLVHRVPGFVFCTTHIEQHYQDILQLMAPQGRLGVIDDCQGPLDAMAMKPKSISLHWELMFTRSMFQTPDLYQQGKLLNVVAEMIDSGKIQSTLTFVAGKINAHNLQQVHSVIESHTTKGKIVLQGF
jgi:NADPH:quinone reductase